MQYDRFTSAEEAFLWAAEFEAYRAAGAKRERGRSPFNRPCFPLDIIKSIDRLTREQKLTKEHLTVLKIYGGRRLPPDPRQIKERRAKAIWDDAMSILQADLLRKGITEQQTIAPHRKGV